MGGFDDILGTDSPGFGDLFMTPEERLRRMRERYPDALPGLGGETENDRSFFERASDYQRASRRSLGASWKRNLWDVTQAPSSVLELSAKAKRAILPKSLEGVATREEELALRAIDALTPESVKRKRDEAARSAEEAKVAKAEAGLRLGLPDAVQVAQNFGTDFISMAADPFELLPGGLAVEGVRGALRGRRAAKAVGEVAPELAKALEAASHAGQGGESVEAISRVSRQERYFRVTQGGEVLPIPNTVDAVDVRLNPGEIKVRQAADGTLDIESSAKGSGTPAQARALEDLRRRPPAAAGGEATPGFAEPNVYELDLGEGLPSERLASDRPPALSRKEFEDRYWFHGKPPDSGTLGDPSLGGLTTSYSHAREYARPSGRKGGEVWAVPEERLSLELAEDEFGDPLKEKPITIRGLTRRVEGEFKIPVDEADPYDFLVRTGQVREPAPGKFRPPEAPFQYSATSLDVPDTALPEIRETMKRPETLARRRTGVEIDYNDPARLPAQEARRELAAGARRDPVRDRFLAKYTGAVPEPEKPKGVEWLRSVGRKIYVEGFNKDAPVEEILALDRNPELVRLVDRERGAAEIARGPLFRGTSTLDLETGQLERTGESLRDILEGLDGEGLKDLDSLLIADRQAELSERLASIRARPENSRLLRATDADPLLATPQGRVDVAAALREVDPAATADAEALVGHLQAKRGEGFGEVAARAQRIREWSRKAILDPLREVGLLSEQEHSRILQANQFYAPYVRVADRAALKLQESGAGFAREITKGLSEDAKITSPLEELVVKSQRVQRWVEKQRIRNAIADVAEANADALGEVIRPATEQEVRGRKSFAVWRNGESRHWAAPDDVIRALDRSNVGDASLLMKAITFPARTLRAGATLTAEFMARNPIRDQFTAAVYSRHGYIPFYDFAKGLFHMSPAGRRLSGIYDEFLDSGTAIASMAQVDRPHVVSTLRDLTGTGAIGKVNSFLRAWRREGALYPLQELSGIGEKGTRVGAYARARSRGVSALDAMNEARDITLDFGRAGHSGRIANGMYAFLNAELQDLDKVRRAFKARPVATSAKALAYIAIPSLANWAMWKDDPDYQNLQSWEKATYYHLKKREDGTFIRMPRPIGVLPLLVGYGLHQFLDFAMERDPQAVEEFVGRIATDTPARFVARPQNLLPTGLEPIAEVSAGPGGWDYWRDTPIVPRGLQDVAPPEQFNDRTPAIVRDAAGAAGASPLKAQHLIKAYTGGLGENVVSIVDAIYREANGEDSKIPELPTTAKDVPLAKGFVSGSPFGFGSRPVNRLYDLADKAQQAELTFKRMRDRGAAASDLLSFRGDHPEILQAKRLREARQKLSDLRDKREKIRTLAHVTPEQRADMLLKIDQAITEYSHRLLVGMGYEVEVGP